MLIRFFVIFPDQIAFAVAPPQSPTGVHGYLGQRLSSESPGCNWDEVDDIAAATDE